MMHVSAEPQREVGPVSNPSIFVGLDVHKDTVAVAVARGYGKAESVAVLPHSAKAVERKLASVGAIEQMQCC